MFVVKTKDVCALEVVVGTLSLDLRSMDTENTTHFFMVVVIAILWFILFASLHVTFTLVTTNLKARLESVEFYFIFSGPYWLYVAL